MSTPPRIPVPTEYLRNNLYKKDASYYNGLRLNEDQKPFAYDLNVNLFAIGESRNEEAINTSIINILLSRFGEYLFEPRIGSSLGATIFERIDANNGEDLLDTVLSEIENIEKRIILQRANAKMSVYSDQNSMTLYIPYVVKETGKAFDFNKKISI
jgi:phage baseplate assembly protein W